MKDFNDFVLYQRERQAEITYDISSALRHAGVKCDNLSQNDISIVTEISFRTTLAFLRQYHDWQTQHPQQ